MTFKSTAMHLLAKTAIAALGRRKLVRLARLLSNEARFDVPNTRYANGEYWLQQRLVAFGEEPLVVVDVGANVGEWSSHLAHCANERGRTLKLHAFEPTATTAAMLRDRLGQIACDRMSVEVAQMAASDHDGEMDLWVVGPGGGRNSLYEELAPGCAAERVTTTRLDTYCSSNGVRHVDFLKIDAEGHDMRVIEGAAELLRARRVAVLQFEYNAGWIFARRFLKDAFEALIGSGYLVGKITPRAIELYRGWHAELESFREANYVALLPEMAPVFETVRWWNDD